MSSNRCRSVLLLCAALLLALAVGALSARQDTNLDDESFDLDVSPSHYKHHGPTHEHRSGDSYDGPDHAPYDRYDHGPYDRPPHRHGRGDYAYEGPSHRHHGYRDEDDYGSYGGKDPSRYHNRYGDDGYYYERLDHYPKNNYYSKPTVCTDCPANTTKCDGALLGNGLLGTYQCLDFRSPFSCGSCTNVCPENSECNGVECVCVAPFTKCGGQCVDLTTNPTFCGSCDNACNSTTPFCSNRTCVEVNPCSGTNVTCFPSQNAEGSCVDLKNDPDNCGACGRVCGTLTSRGQCTDGHCCADTGESCRLGLQCCGWNPLSLIPPGLLPDSVSNVLVVPSARCEPVPGSIFPFPLALGKCCKGVVMECDPNKNQCCDGLACQDMLSVPIIGALGYQCQPPNCGKQFALCSGSRPCCAGFSCFLGRCSYSNVLP